MGSLVRSGIFPGLSGKKSWKNCKYKMTKYKNTNIKTSKVQIHPKNKLENLSNGLSRSKWHLPWAFRNRRIAADILSRSGLHKIRSNEIQKFFRPNLIWGFSAKCLIESICILPMLDKKKEQSGHGKNISDRNQYSQTSGFAENLTQRYWSKYLNPGL